jgi:hypothetical protein
MLSRRGFAGSLLGLGAASATGKVLAGSTPPLKSFKFLPYVSPIELFSRRHLRDDPNVYIMQDYVKGKQIKVHLLPVCGRSPTVTGAIDAFMEKVNEWCGQLLHVASTFCPPSQKIQDRHVFSLCDESREHATFQTSWGEHKFGVNKGLAVCALFVVGETVGRVSSTEWEYSASVGLLVFNRNAS